MTRLNGKVAVVVGGSSGFGESIARRFVAEGAQVVVNGRDAEKGARALAEMDAGDNAYFLPGDVQTRAGCESIVNGTVDHFGRIDILFANAGGASNHAPVVDLTDEAMETRIVKTKRFHLGPLTPDEAALKMDLLGHGFFFFINRETGRSAVVYQREDGDVGLIDEAD